VRKQLNQHLEDLGRHFKQAADFLVRCQIAEPYVRKGILRGAVCPWEIGVLDTYGFTILEDFHDTLEALWVWSYYTGVSDDGSYRSNIDRAWKYVVGSFDRFVPADASDEGLFDCSLVALAGSRYERVFGDKSYRRWVEKAGNRLAHYLREIQSPRGREYADPWWMTACLATAARNLGRDVWLESATAFTRRSIIKRETPFSSVGREPRHKGPGGHGFFSNNANKALALASCFPSEALARETIVQKFLPVTPKRFVERHVDDNPWNANVAAALGRSFLLTGEEEFLTRYFAVMNELERRDVQGSSALARSEEFPVRESWVTFFYAYAYASVTT
jgi:hypothetical protein